MQQAAEAHRQLEGGNVHERIILTLGRAAAQAEAPPGPLMTCR